jgi:pimeloyl-ACP methyl ester carboxylesterase
VSDHPEHPTPEEAVRAPGPWEHRHVGANGARFHIATMGSGPAVLLVHGFPTYWYTWRHLLPVLADAGYRAIAMDLRGYGGTDHTPRGYDPFSLAADIRGVIRSLGHSAAAVIGHGWGAFTAWTAAALHPDTVQALGAVAMPHPVRLRYAITHDPEQRRLSRYAMGFQLPRSPERRLVADDAAQIEQYLREWCGPQGWPDEQSLWHFRRAFQYRATAHCSLEYHRWAVRSIPRPDGVRYVHRMEQPIIAPVLQVHGLADGAVLPRSVDGSEEFVTGDYRREDLPGIGHFVHEEAPTTFADLLLPWLEQHAPAPIAATANSPLGTR